MMSIKSTLILNTSVLMMCFVNTACAQDSKACSDRVTQSINQLASGNEKQSLKKEMQFLFREKISKTRKISKAHTSNDSPDYGQEVEKLCTQRNAQDQITLLKKSLKKKQRHQSMIPMKAPNFDQNKFANR